MKWIHLYFLFILFSVFLGQGYGQNKTVVISGRIEGLKQESLPFATLNIKGHNGSILADSLGLFSVRTTSSEKVWLFCSNVGFESDSLFIPRINDSVFVVLKLKPLSNSLKEVNIVMRRNPDVVPRTYTLNEYDIVTTAGAVGDVAAALQTFPGAAPAGNETGLFVHGGTANETQAYFDGMLVKNAFGSRLPDVANRSRFSAFLFERTLFTTNEYEAEYGQALSSIFKMDTKGIPNGSSTEFSIISLGMGAAHTERFKNSSLMIGGNYYDFGLNNKIIAQNTRWKDNPKQYQTSAHYKLATEGSGILKLYMDYSDTKLSFDIKNPEKQRLDLLENRNRNLFFSGTYSRNVWNGWKMFIGTSFNGTRETGFVDQVYYFQTDNVWHQKLMVTRKLRYGGLLNFGTEIFNNLREEGYDRLNRDYNDFSLGSFVSGKFYLNKYLAFDIGVRNEYSRYLKKANLSPRTSIIVPFMDRNQFRLNFGTYYQKPDDSFLAQTNDLEYEKSVNYALVYEYKIPGRNLRIEGYQKNYHRLVKIETPIFSGFQAYGPPILIEGFNNKGEGYARGVDLFWRDQSLMVGEYYISYSYVDTKRNYIDYPALARPPFAPKHTLNAVFRKYLPNQKIQFSTTYTFSSGRSYFNPSSTRFMNEQTRNYHNVSAGLSYLPAIGKSFSVINLSVSNLFGFNQIYGYRYSYDGSRREAILPPSRRTFLISFLVNLGDGQFNH